MDKGKVSVIIPVYNAQPYLKEALDSILRQSYENMEIFLIECGSDDKSMEIVEKYGKKDSRIRILEEEKLTPGTARNCGLESAEGEYFLFVDADDYLPDDQIVEQLVMVSEKTDCDIAVCNYERLWDQEFLPATGHRAFSMLDRNSEEFRFRGFFSVGTLSYVWGKLYKREFLEKNALKFSEFEYAEDKLFNLQCYICGAGYAFVETVGYIYRKNEQSVSHQYKEQSSRCWLGIAEALELWISEQQEPEDPGKAGRDDRYDTLSRYIIFFAAFFDAKMEYMEHKKSLRAVWKILKIYGKDEAGRACFRDLLKDPHIRELSQPMWRVMIKGFAFGMKMHFFAGLSLGIKLLIDLKIDERLSDTGLRKKKNKITATTK